MGQRSDFSKLRHGAAEKSANATRKAARSAVSNQPGGLLLSPRAPPSRNVYRGRSRSAWDFFFVANGFGMVAWIALYFVIKWAGKNGIKEACTDITGKKSNVTFSPFVRY